MLINYIKIFLPAIIAFILGILITPIASHFFYKFKMWKKYSRNQSTNLEFQKIHNEKEELKTPRVGGIIIWFSISLTILLFFIFSLSFPSVISSKINFLSRGQTLIPFFALILGSILGLWDDLIQIYGKGKIARDDKTWRRWKVLIITFISLLIGLWFFYKLGMTTIHIPFGGEFFVGILIIPIFIIVSLATFSGGVIDGIDGLSGGVLASIFAAYTVIAFSNQQIDLAAFSATITGATLAFLWFNIPPARFYMGETGILGLAMTLSVVAFLTNSVIVLPIIGAVLVVESASVMIQLISKKLRHGKKVFLVAPIHHHFEAKGWPAYKVTMRFWVISFVMSILGLVIVLIDKTL